MKLKSFLILFLLSAMFLQAKPIKTLLITGHTDKWHNWQTSSPYLKAILDAQGIFKTDILLMKDTSGLDASFSPEFANYQVVVLMLNEVKWSEKTKTSFEKFVKNGGGVVSVHETDNAFPEWKEFNLMTGLGGWGMRNEKSGPYYFWKDGQYITDHTPGPAGKHGNRVPFVINVRDTEHPITKGLPTKWLHQNFMVTCAVRFKICMYLLLPFLPKKRAGQEKKNRFCLP